MFKRISDRDEFGRPRQHRSASAAKLGFVSPSTVFALKNSLVDISGNDVPVTNNGVILNAQGQMVFNGSSTYFQISPANIPGVLTATNEFCIEMVFTPDSTGQPTYPGLLGDNNASPRWDWAWYTNGSFSMLTGAYSSTGWTPDEKQTLSMEYWYDDSATAWKLTIRRNNAVMISAAHTMSVLSTFCIGWINYSDRHIKCTMDSFRIINGRRGT